MFQIKQLLTQLKNNFLKKYHIKKFEVAINHRDYDKIVHLVGLGIDINHKDENGNNALHYACYSKNLNLAKWLIENHADVNIINNSKESPLLITISGRHDEDSFKIVKLLLNKGVNIEYDNDLGSSPLLMSVIAEDILITDILLKEGANMFKENNLKLDVFHYIFENRDFTSFKCILKYVKNIEQVDLIEERIKLYPQIKQETDPYFNPIKNKIKIENLLEEKAIMPLKRVKL